MVAYAILGLVLAMVTVILCIATLVVAVHLMHRFGIGVDQKGSGDSDDKGD